MRRFAVFDIDGTLIRWQLYHAVADALAKEGHIKPETYQAIREARMLWKRRSGESSFKGYERQLILMYEEVLRTLSLEQMEKAVDAVFDEYRDQVYTYTRKLIEKLKAKNYFLLAISGSQTEAVAKIADYYGFGDYVGTVYEYKAGSFTGHKTVGSLRKDLTLKRLVKKHSLDFEGSLAVGDSASDISMLELVEEAIAFNPEKELFEHAKDKGWKVIVERKNMVYEFKSSKGKYYLAETNA